MVDIGRSGRIIAVVAVVGALVAASDAIAVRRYTRTGDGLPGGSGWRTTPSVACRNVMGRRDVFGELSGITATGPRDAWAAGYCGTTGAPGVWGTYVGLIEHWNGRRWLRVPTPQAQSYTSVVAVSPRDAWATAGPSHAPGISPPAAIHWDGHRWSPAADGLPRNAAFEALAVTSSGVWGVADTGDASSPFLVRRQAGSWSRVTVPGPPMGDLDYSSAMGVDPAGGLWLGLQGTADRAEIAHYQDGRWALLPVPRSRRYSDLTAVAVTSDGTCTVTTEEYDSQEDASHRTRVRAWDGRRWTRRSTPTGFDIDKATSDGHGGLWLWSSDGHSLIRGDSRHWTGAPQPLRGATTKNGETLTAEVPGTSALWNVGADHFRTVPRSTFPFSAWGQPVIKAFRP
ncbi:hypothetical protein [Actinoallomurus iriomotensis]|uniref:Uncharacterized protein n=1 Tax=Actinoallomurus iriomotensis TaxID=478107 RepID=A0A9W6S1W5_9ACTN|nr:hypothetical protein [Actinoallomurus iriomotensis]GLY85756.1 hypothetical protein Airi02_036850 [Actinoallomurus iriomotensis]